MAEQKMSTGAVATMAGIRDACRDVTATHHVEGRAVCAARTEAEWRARAEHVAAGIARDWADPYVLAYTEAALAAVRMLADLN